MELKRAIIRRIYNLANEHHVMLNSLANNAGLTPSTIYSLVTNKKGDVKISTINKICQGLDISLQVFFDDPLFDDLD